MESVNFLEACEALRDGKCKEIEDRDGNSYRLRDGIILDSVVEENDLSFEVENLLGKWDLIGVQKKMVIENVGWDKDNIVLSKGRFDWVSLLDKPKMKITYGYFVNMEEDSNGKWVEWKDVEGLIIENRELTARNKRLIQITNQEGIKEDGI